MEFMLAQIAMYCVAPWVKKAPSMDKFIPHWGESEDERKERGTREAMLSFGFPKEILDGEH